MKNIFGYLFNLNLILVLAVFAFLGIEIKAQITEVDSLTKIVRDFEAQGKKDTAYAQSLYDLAMAQNYDGDVNEAINLTKKAIKLPNNTTDLKFSLHNSLGAFYLAKNNFIKSLNEFKIALEIAISASDKVKEGVVHYNISTHYDHTENDSLSYVHLLKAYDLMIETGDSVKTFSLQNGLGLAEIQRNNFEEAKKWYDKSLQLATELDDSVLLSTCYNNLGTYYLETKDTTTSLVFLKKSFLIDEKMGSDYDITVVSYNIGNMYNLLNKYDSATIYFNIALQHANTIGNFKLLEDIYSKIYTANFKTNNFDTLLTLFQEYQDISDTILSQENLNKYAETLNEIELITTNKELEIMHVSQKSNRQKLIFLTLIAILLVVVLIGSVVARKNLQKQKDLAEKLHHKSLIQKVQIEEQQKELLTTNASLEENAKAKDRIMSLLAHDLRTPFSSISNLNHLINEIGNLNKEQVEYMKTSDKIVHSGLNLISDILDIYKLENFTNFDNDLINISQLLSNSVEKIGPNTLVNKQTVTSHFRSNIEFQTNREMMQSAIDNLLSNASKYSHENQEIIISADIIENNLIVKITDFGQGFKKEEQDIIFDRFNKFTRSTISTESSTGLGLYLVRGFVESLNGKISLESTWGEGSTFTLEFKPQ